MRHKGDEITTQTETFNFLINFTFDQHDLLKRDLKMLN